MEAQNEVAVDENHQRYVIKMEGLLLQQNYIFLTMSPGVALGKGEVGDRFRPHLKIRSHLKIF